MKLSLLFAGAVVLVCALLLGAASLLVSRAQDRTLETQAFQRAREALLFEEAFLQAGQPPLCPETRRPANGTIFGVDGQAGAYRRAFEALAQQLPDYAFREISLRPLNRAHLAEPDEAAVIARFQSEPNLQEIVGTHFKGGQDEFYVARPMTVHKHCLKCHSSIAAAPPEVQHRFTNPSSYGWQEGDRHSALVVALPADQVRAEQWAARRRTLTMFSIVAVVLTVLVYMVFRALVQRPLRQAAVAIAEMARDTSGSIDVRDAGSHELNSVVQNSSKIAESLRQANLALESRVKELAQARAQALEASHAKTTFLATMSHELRTPLNHILGYTEMLQEEAVEQGQEQFLPDLQKILISGKHLLELIDDILSLAMIEAGKLELHLEIFDVPTLVKETVQKAESGIRKNGNAFEVECPIDVGIVYSDRNKVRQCLLNLLSNAGKFTEKGRVALTVSRRGLGGMEWVDFRVTDTGIGISADHLQKLFQPFHQLDASATRRYGGSGLGLAVCRRYCQLLGGDIAVQSDLGKGSMFTLQLPAQAKAEGGKASTIQWTDKDSKTPEPMTAPNGADAAAKQATPVA